MVDVVLIGHEKGRVLRHRHMLECVTCEVGDTPVPCGQQREGGGVKPDNKYVNVEVYYLLCIPLIDNLELSQPFTSFCCLLNDELHNLCYVTFTNLLC